MKKNKKSFSPRKLGLWQRFRQGWIRLRQQWQQIARPSRFLCDSCRYDYGNACRRPGRPNVKSCPDYRPR